MKTIEWKVVLTDDNKIASLEHGTNLPVDSVESQLTIIGILENLKQKHLGKLQSQFSKTVKKGGEE